MANDLLNTICVEIDERLRELHPLLAEQERLLDAAEALATSGRNGTATVVAPVPTKRARKARVVAGRRGSTVRAIEATEASPTGAATSEVEIQSATGKRSTAMRPAAKAKPDRAARGAVREAILAALGHGSHTVAELAVVTAMSAPNINGNLRKLASEGAVVKTEREGKSAWALPHAAG